MANTYKNAAVVMTSTGATDLYTVPAGIRAIVQSVNVANVDGSDRYVTVTWYDSSAAASYTLLYNALIPAGTSLNALDTPAVLEPGDIIRVQASAANTLHATASILQIDSTSQYPDASVTTAKLADGSVTNTKMASGVSPLIICTSSTRPGSPVEGQGIWETDTDKFLVYTGAAWYPPWNMPWGIVGRGQATGNQSGITTAVDLTGCSVTFTAVSGRLYKTTAHTLTQQVTNTGRIAFAIADGSNSWKQEAQEYMPVNEYGHMSLVLYESGLSGSVTRKLRMLTTSGSCISLGSSNSPTQIIVEDIGPS